MYGPRASCSFGSRKKLIRITLARLPHIAKRQAVTCQCRDAILECSGSLDAAEEIPVLGLAAVLLAWPALSYVALYPKCMVIEPLTLLPAGPVESVVQGIEKLRFMITLETFRQCTSKNLEHGSMEYLHTKVWIFLVAPVFFSFPVYLYTVVVLVRTLWTA